MSVIVLIYLQEQGVTAENPAADRQKRIIYRFGVAQRSGMVIVDTADRADAHGFGHADLLARLRRRVEQSIESQAQMQPLHVQADLSPSERTSFANSIEAELVILLDARGEPVKAVSPYTTSVNRTPCPMLALRLRITSEKNW